MPSLVVGIQAQENKQENRKSQQRRTAVAQKRQGYTYNRHHTNHHTNIDQQMHKEKTNYTMPVNPRKNKALSVCHKNQPDQQIGIYDQKQG